MPTATYSYRVRDKSGQLLSGEVAAESAAQVAATLRSRGFVPLSIDAKSSPKALQKDLHIPGLTDRISLKDVAVLSRQLATMIESGLTLLRALTILVQQTENKALCAIVEQVRGDVEKGEALSVSMNKHPKAFSPLYVAMIRAGETGGVLEGTLVRLAGNLEKQVKLRGQIRSAMAYPTVVCVLVLLIVTAMLIFIVPMFQGLYADLGGTLPLPTKLLLGVSAFIKKLWFIILPAMIGAVFMFRRWIATEKGRAAWDVFKLRMPVFGGLVHKTALARFTRNFSALLRSGVPILQSLQIVSDTAGNAVVKKGVLEIQASVKEGVSMAEPMARFPTVFPPMVVQMTAVGEETGALDDLLAKIADFYEDEVEATVSALTSLIEPLLIVVMGLAVGGMLIALYMPMFNVINLIQ